MRSDFYTIRRICMYVCITSTTALPDFLFYFIFPVQQTTSGIAVSTVQYHEYCVPGIIIIMIISAHK